MKKLLTLLLSLLMVFTLFGCNSKKEEPTTTTNEPVVEIQEEVKQEEPVIVEEIKEEKVEEPVVIEEPEKEEVKIISNDDVTQMSFWVVFYGQYGNELQREALKYGTIPSYKVDLPAGFEKWVYKKSQKDANISKAITGNTYYQAICHEVKHHSSGSTPTPSIPTPNKGEIIYLDDKPYKVLSTNGTQVKLLCMYDMPLKDYNSTSRITDEYGQEGQKYADSILDNYLNGDNEGDFYHSLPDAIKSAIVPQVVTQSMYKDTFLNAQQDTGFNFQYNWGSYINLAYVGSATIGTRNVYSLGLEDIFEYYSDDNTVTSDEINLLFFDSTSQINKYLRLSTVDGDGNDYVFGINGNKASIISRPFDDFNYEHEPRPVFVIELAGGLEWSTNAPQQR